MNTYLEPQPVHTSPKSPHHPMIFPCFMLKFQKSHQKSSFFIDESHPNPMKTIIFRCEKKRNPPRARAARASPPTAPGLPQRLAALFPGGGPKLRLMGIPRGHAHVPPEALAVAVWSLWRYGGTFWVETWNQDFWGLIFSDVQFDSLGWFVQVILGLIYVDLKGFQADFKEHPPESPWLDLLQSWIQVVILLYFHIAIEMVHWWTI